MSGMLLIYLATTLTCDQSVQQLIMVCCFFFFASDLLALRTEAEWEEVRQRICDLPQDEALTAEFNSKVPPSSIFSDPPPPPLPPRLIIGREEKKIDGLTSDSCVCACACLPGAANHRSSYF